MKIFEIIIEKSANWVQKITEIFKKKTFFNAADILDAGGDEKQVFLKWPKHALVQFTRVFILRLNIFGTVHAARDAYIRVTV